MSLAKPSKACAVIWEVTPCVPASWYLCPKLGQGESLSASRTTSCLPGEIRNPDATKDGQIGMTENLRIVSDLF
jgi:hypothetical protein